MEKEGYERRLKERSDELEDKQRKAEEISRVRVKLTNLVKRKKQFLAYKELNNNQIKENVTKQYQMQ